MNNQLNKMKTIAMTVLTALVLLTAGCAKEENNIEHIYGLWTVQETITYDKCNDGKTINILGVNMDEQVYSFSPNTITIDGDRIYLINMGNFKFKITKNKFELFDNNSTQYDGCYQLSSITFTK